MQKPSRPLVVIDLGWAPYAERSEEQLRDEAELWADGQFGADHPATVSPASRRWRYEAAFPIERLAAAPPRWDRWLTEECVAAAEAGMPDRYTHLFEEWDIRAQEYPVCVVEGSDGEFYLLDGYHRVGVASVLGKATLPAIVGWASLTRRDDVLTGTAGQADHSARRDRTGRASVRGAAGRDTVGR
jgi:hypothetical protein